METLIHADVFFFVTTIAVVLVAATFTTALIYLILILKDVKSILGGARDEIREVIAAVGHFRENIRENGLSLGQILSFFNLGNTAQKRSKYKPKSKEKNGK